MKVLQNVISSMIDRVLETRFIALINYAIVSSGFGTVISSILDRLPLQRSPNEPAQTQPNDESEANSDQFDDVESEVASDSELSEQFDDVESEVASELFDDGETEALEPLQTKDARGDVLRRWKKAVHAINVCVTLVHESAMARKKIRDDIRTNYLIAKHALIIEAARPSEESSQTADVAGTTNSPLRQVHSGDFGISSEELVSMSREHDYSLLQQNGGVRGVAQKLKSNVEKGLSEDETDLTNRKMTFGSNTYPSKRSPSMWRILREACRNPVLIILMVAAAAIIGLGMKTEGSNKGLYEGGSIALAVLIVTILTAASDYKQSILLHKWEEEKQNIQTEVVRSGRRVKISIFDIVVGDVVPMKVGDQVPADGILISCHAIMIDESNMTGESMPIYKDSSAPFLRSGCKVADGYGTMLVTSVGLNTLWGEMMASVLIDPEEETPLQVRLKRVATALCIVGLATALTILLVLLFRFFTGYTKYPDGSTKFKAQKTSIGDAVDGIIKIIAVAVTVVVIAVPEALPLSVTLTLSHSMREMIADKILVRRLATCEKMGTATTICVDKTGIITLNQMTVVEVYACGKKVECPDNKSLIPPTIVSLLIEGIAYNTTGSVFAAEGGGALEVYGSPTEKALLLWGVNVLGMDFDGVQSDSVVIHACPFNSEIKRSSVAIIPETYQSNSKVHVHWKGAAEIVLAACTRYIDENDCVVTLDKDKLYVSKEAIEDMAARGLRCVAIAYRPHEMDSIPVTAEELKNWKLPETDLVLLAIIGIKDPCQPSVIDYLRKCTLAGIKVCMVTGDSLQTARAVALECGIIGPDTDESEPNVIEGRTFRCLSERRRTEVADKILVMGRSSPHDKLLLVQALRNRGQVVAVTGDSCNDLPALHEADIGLAMGLQGTEMAKGISDIVLLDDSFCTIVKVVKWGRSVYANTQKFIEFQFTVIIASLLINIAGAAASGNVPLNAVQLLWINFFMDTLGVLALATEPPTDQLMHGPPIGRREPLITSAMWRNLMIQALYQVTVILALNFLGRSILHLEHEPRSRALEVKNTVIFNAFVFCQIFNMINTRSPDEINVLKGITKNSIFLCILSFMVGVQVIIIELLGNFTATVRLSWKLWITSVAIGFLSCPLAAAGKLIPVTEENLRRFFTDYIYRPRHFGDHFLHQESAVSATISGSIELGRTFDLESGTEISKNTKAIANIFPASDDKLSDEDFQAYLSDFGFPTMGFPVIFSRNAVNPIPEEIEMEKRKHNSGIFGLYALLEFLSKAPFWSSNLDEVDPSVDVQSARDEHTAEAVCIDLVNESGEDMEEKSSNV